MRVLQLIDSLDPGGAERMAVTIANSLSSQIECAALCTTRKEGSLKHSLNSSVDYLFLSKKGAMDVFSWFRLLNYIKKMKINVLHAHSSSFFFATLVKLVRPKTILIWHDHYGKSEQLAARKTRVLKFCSRYFNTIISVNEILKDWAIQELHCKNVHFIKNFVPVAQDSDVERASDGNWRNNLICLANFRAQKDHLNLLEAFKLVRISCPQATLHLIGKVVDSGYYERVSDYIAHNTLEQVVLHGEQQEILRLLRQCSIGVISSDSEGLPVALLEYGVAGIAVVTTDVGECASVVNNFGKVVQSSNPKALAHAIVQYLEDQDLRDQNATDLHKHIIENYSDKAVLPKIMALYKI